MKRNNVQNINTDLSDDIKQLILFNLKSGKKQKEIAEILGISKQRLNYHIIKEKSGRKFCSKRNSGRKTKDTKEISELIIKEVEENRFITGPALAKIVQEKFGMIINTKTIKRVIKKDGYNARSPRKVPLINEKIKISRVEIAKKFLMKPFEYWKTVIWSDETKINLFGSDGKSSVWRKPKEAYDNKCTIKTVKHTGGNIMIWGCVSYEGVGNIVILEGNMTGGNMYSCCKKICLNLLKKFGLKSSFVFQQDNDPKHKSRIARIFSMITTLIYWNGLHSRRI
jgi:transposase